MKRIFALLTILTLTLCLTATAFASNGTRVGEVVGGGSAETGVSEDASRHHSSGTGSGGTGSAAAGNTAAGGTATATAGGVLRRVRHTA